MSRPRQPEPPDDDAPPWERPNATWPRHLKDSQLPPMPDLAGLDGAQAWQATTEVRAFDAARREWLASTGRLTAAEVEELTKYARRGPAYDRHEHSAELLELHEAATRRRR